MTRNRWLAPTPFAECPGDLTCDGSVNTDDLTIVINNWGTCPSSGPCPGDLNEDDTVDSDDLLIVINGWGVCDAGESSAMGVRNPKIRPSPKSTWTVATMTAKQTAPDVRASHPHRRVDGRCHHM